MHLSLSLRRSNASFSRSCLRPFRLNQCWLSRQQPQLTRGSLLSSFHRTRLRSYPLHIIMLWWVSSLGSGQKWRNYISFSSRWIYLSLLQWDFWMHIMLSSIFRMRSTFTEFGLEGFSIPVGFQCGFLSGL